MTWFTGFPLRFQLVALQLGIVLAVLTAVGAVTIRMQEQQLRDAYKGRLIGVAESVARLPSVINAFGTPSPAQTIQPIAEVIRQASNVTYVVVTDRHGVRQSHPNPAEIGRPVSTDPSVPLSGEIYVGTQTGTLGESWRVKVPIFDAAGTVIGSASVGVLESTLAADLYEDMPQLFGWLLGAALLSSLGAMYVSKLVWRRIYKLEPEDIAALLETRDAMLHGLGEGLVAVDADGRVALVNDEARRLLALAGTSPGRPPRRAWNRRSSAALGRVRHGGTGALGRADPAGQGQCGHRRRPRSRQGADPARPHASSTPSCVTATAPWT